MWQPLAGRRLPLTGSPAVSWLTPPHPPLLPAGLVSLSSFIWLVIFGWTYFFFFECTLHYIFHSSMHHTHWWCYWLFVLVEFCWINLKLKIVHGLLVFVTHICWAVTQRSCITFVSMKFNSLRFHSLTLPLTVSFISHWSWEISHYETRSLNIEHFLLKHVKHH